MHVDSKFVYKNMSISSETSPQTCLLITQANNSKENSAVVDKKDLDELRTLYTKCKNVIKKIEHKYGHLLHLKEDTTENKRKKRKVSASSEENLDQCNCAVKKKILFDEDGNKTIKEFVANNHICFPKTVEAINVQKSSNEIDVDVDCDDNLPHDLSTLSDILLQPEINVVYRNKVMNKMKIIKRDSLNEMKLNKSQLIEQSKVAPDSVFEFKGANISLLTGYL